MNSFPFASIKYVHVNEKKQNTKTKIYHIQCTVLYCDKINMLPSDIILKTLTQRYCPAILGVDIACQLVIHPASCKECFRFFMIGVSC